MTPEIDAIFLDLGNTLRILLRDEAHQARARREMARLAGTTEDPDAFCAEIDRRYKVYRKWATAEWIEAPEAELWVKWLAYDYPHERLIENAEELTYQYRCCKGERKIVPNGVETIDALDRRGYTLGIISDLIGTREIGEWLKNDHLTHYFKSVELSSVCCYRKPHPEIYLRALRTLDVPAEQCAFVGDNLQRDIIGAKNVGFGFTIAVAYPDAAPPKGSKYAVMGTGAYFSTMLLFCIPVIGWVSCVIMAFAGGNLNRKHFARAMLVFLIIGIMLSVALYFVSSWVMEVLLETYAAQSGLYSLAG